jgi:hypothetical protein
VLYDPKTGWFDSSRALNIPRGYHTATLLRDGRVLIAGGAAAYGKEVAPAELYDPSTGDFTITGSMVGPGASQTATLLSDGRVLISGGWVDQAEIYNPSTGTFSTTGCMSGATECPAG